MEAVISEILRPVVKILTDHLVRKLRYLTYRKKYVEDMGDKKNDLIAKRDEVQNHICNHNISSRETPVTVKGWMEKVEKVEREAETISRTHIGCSNITTWYEVGKDAFNALKTINDLIIEYPGTSWNRIRIPLGHVDSSTSAPASSSSGGETKSDYDSRDKLFKEALKFLQQDDPTRVIALCGMGGVGKTTMMEQLRKHVEDKKMFNQIVMAVIGRDRDMLSVQRDVAAYTGGPLTDQQGVTATADCLRKRFEDMLKAGKKILVILDDVWGKIELKNIGLWSPLPKEVKLLLTSRDENVCTKIAADVLSAIEVVKVEALVEAEARKLFFQSIGLEVVDDDLYEIGCGIVKKCGCLPLAIKIIAGTLLHKEKSEWVSTLECLKNKDLTDDLKGIIEVSYEALGNEEREILLLCGMHPEDSNIKIEDLTRYAWGLGLVKKAPTFMYARGKTEKWVSNLKSANMLMNSDESGCVKMHDLVLAFVVDSVSKGEDEWIIDHGYKSDWNKVRMSESCKRISLSCWGMSDFPSDLKFQNLSVLKLLDGDDSLKFPPDFYKEMKEIKVIGYEYMGYPLLPTSSQYSPNLRTLCLNKCELSFDYSCIGNLISLEVLSFANSNIKKLPSTFQNLKKLRLLDLTDCSDLVIDDGVLGNLGELEELYVGVYDEKKGISFTDCNYEELAKISENLYALEIEFQSQSPVMLSEKLKRFKISVDIPLQDSKLMQWESDEVSYTNTLMFNTSKDRLLKSRMNKLFEKTEHLFLAIDDMEHLEDVDVHPPPPSSSFHNLRSLTVVGCGKLSYLFTLNVAIALSRLETLVIGECTVMESIIHIEGNGAQTITFPELSNLLLGDLPELSCLCNNVNEIQLPRLLVLGLSRLSKFTSIYPKNELATSLLNKQVVVPKLEKLYIEEMGNLEEEEEISNVGDNILNVAFPSYSMHNFHHLRNLILNDWKRVEVVFEIESGSSKELAKTQQQLLLPYLKDIKLEHMEWMSHVWKCNWNEFLILQKQLDVPFQNLTTIKLYKCNIIKYLFSPLMVKLLSNLKKIKIKNCGCMEEVVSNMDDINDEEMPISSSSSTQTIPTFLDSLSLWDLPNLKRIGGGGEAGRNEVSSINTTTTMSSKVCQVDVVPWSLCQYSREIHIERCPRLSSVIPSYALGHMQKLEVLEIKSCMSVIEVFETEGINNIADISTSNNVAEGSNDTDPTLESPRPKNINNVPQLLNLKKVHIDGCKLLQHVFTFSALEILKQLEKLKIGDCEEMTVIVKEENGEQTEKGVVFPRLKSIELYDLPKLEGFFLGMNNFLWESLEQVVISGCPQIRLFTTGRSTAPMLNFIHIDYGKYSLEQGLNFQVTTANLDQTTSLCPATSEGKP